jgi:hypothetical protein
MMVFTISTVAQNEAKCDIAAFVADPASGVNVRARAGLSSKIIKTIPRDSGGTLVFIDGSKGDWMKISRAVNSKKTHVFSGVGWVHAPLFFVKTRGDGDDLVMYYRNPRTETEEMGRIRSGLEVLVQGCSGDWINVLIPQRGTEGFPAWLPHGSFCGSPWEDCE